MIRTTQLFWVFLFILIINANAYALTPYSMGHETEVPKSSNDTEKKTPLTKAQIVQIKKNLEDATDKLDYLNEELEEYGTISVSAPFLTLVPKDPKASPFFFDLENTPKTYYDEKRTQGGASLTQFTGITQSLGVNASLPQLDTIFNPKTATAANGTQNPNSPQPKEAPDVTLSATNSLPINPATGVPLSPTSTSSGNAVSFKAEEFTISPRQKVLLANGDYTTQKMLSFLSAPTAIGDNKIAYLCVLTVNCTPGNRTFKNYAAEIVVNVKYGRANEETKQVESVPSTTASPLVCAAYPLLDGQVLDLTSNISQQTSVALMLSAMGYQMKAKEFFQYVKALQQTVQTKSVVTIGHSVSYGGSTFGYRIEPQLVALNNPASKSAKPEMILESTSFPALVVLVMDKDDIDKTHNGSEPNGANHLLFEITTRWQRIANAAVQSHTFGRWRNLWGKPRLTENRIYERAEALDEAEKFLKSAEADLTGESWLNHQYISVKRRLEAYRANMEGFAQYQELIKGKVECEECKLSEIYPSKAKMTEDSIFFIDLAKAELYTAIENPPVGVESAAGTPDKTKIIDKSTKNLLDKLGGSKPLHTGHNINFADSIPHTGHELPAGDSDPKTGAKTATTSNKPKNKLTDKDLIDLKNVILFIGDQKCELEYLKNGVLKATRPKKEIPSPSKAQVILISSLGVEIIATVDLSVDQTAPKTDPIVTVVRGDKQEILSVSIKGDINAALGILDKVKDSLGIKSGKVSIKDGIIIIEP